MKNAIPLAILFGAMVAHALTAGVNVGDGKTLMGLAGLASALLLIIPANALMARR